MIIAEKMSQKSKSGTNSENQSVKAPLRSDKEIQW